MWTHKIKDQAQEIIRTKGDTIAGALIFEYSVKTLIRNLAVTMLTNNFFANRHISPTCSIPESKINSITIHHHISTKIVKDCRHIILSERKMRKEDKLGLVSRDDYHKSMCTTARLKILCDPTVGKVLLV